jgi:hypothetical protein
LKQDFLE